MSTILVSIFKDEAGVHTNPATSQLFQTECNDGIVQKKPFREVFIHWDAGLTEWIEDPVFVPGQSVVALKVENPCTAAVAYLNYQYNDFRIKQYCCVDESENDDIFVDAFANAFV